MGLKKFGWPKPPPKIGEELVLSWVKNGLLAFGYPLNRKTKDFSGKKFEKLGIKSDNNGNVTATLWIKQPAGMICRECRQSGKLYFF